jgi:hypothetical protein
MHVPCCLHVAQYVVLQLGNRLQRVSHCLVLLNIADYLCRLCALGKVDEVGLLDNGGDTIFDKGEIRQVDTYARKVSNCPRRPGVTRGCSVPKKGMHGGFAA